MKTRLFTILVFLLAVVHVFGQSVDNTVYVKQFPGVNVGTKVAAAMASCNPDPRVPCILVLDRSLASLPSGVMPTLCAQCSLMDYRSGVPYLQNVSDGVIQAQSFCATTGPVDARACFGAKGDLKSARGCSMTGTALSCPSATFAAGDIGKTIYVQGAGTASGSLASTIAAFTDSHHASLADTAKTVVGNSLVFWGSNDTTALQNAYTLAAVTGRGLYIPSGSYMHHGLNWTGNATRIRGESYGGTMLYAFAVTNPGKTTARAQSTGVDMSGSGYNEVDNIAFFGSWAGFSDLAPVVNVLMSRVSDSWDPHAFSIAHIFDNDFFLTQGPINVFNHGYEQTHYKDCHFEDGGTVQGNVIISAANTAGILSPYTTVVGLTSTTAISFSGERSVIAGVGPLAVIDQGSGINLYSIAFRDLYVSIASGDFLVDLGTGPLRDVVLDKVNLESATGNCSGRAINIHGPAWNWSIRNMEAYPACGPYTVAPYQFSGGFLDSYAQVDAVGSPVTEFDASTCQGSILQLGQEQPATTCVDYLLMGSNGGPQGAVIAAANFGSVTKIPSSGVTRGMGGMGWNATGGQGEVDFFNSFIGSGGFSFYKNSGSGYSLLGGFDPSSGRFSANGGVNIGSGKSYQVNGTAGYTGTKTAGTCVLTINGGIITNVTGC